MSYEVNIKYNADIHPLIKETIMKEPILRVEGLVMEYEGVLESLSRNNPKEYSITQYYYRWKEPTYSGDKDREAYITIISNDNCHFGVFMGEELRYIIANPLESFDRALLNRDISIYPCDGARYGELIYSYK